MLRLFGVNPLVQNSNHLLGDLRRLNHLKDISIKIDGMPENVKKTTNDKSRRQENIDKLKR